MLQVKRLKKFDILQKCKNDLLFYKKCKNSIFHDCPMLGSRDIPDEMVRYKNRYIVFELHLATPSSPFSLSPRRTLTPPLTTKDLYHALLTTIQSNYGDTGVAKIHDNLNMKYYNPETNLALLRCARDHARMVWTCLTMMSVVRKDVFCACLVLRLVGMPFFCLFDSFP